jgi:chromosome segregation ATPase
LISAAAFSSYLHCTKLSNEVNNAKETGLFTLVEISELHQKLVKIKDAFANCKVHGDAVYLNHAFKAFRQRIEGCEQGIQELKTELESISSALQPIHSRLVEIKRELQQLLGRKNPHAFSLFEVQVLQDEVREIDSARIDGKFMTKDHAVVPGQASVIFLLESCFDDIHELVASKDPVDSENLLRDVYEDLIKTKARLEHMVIYSRWCRMFT